MMRLLLLLLGLAQTPCATDDTASKILVHIPFQDHNPDGFEHMKAQYGFETIPEGSIAEYVYFIDHDLCEPIMNRTIGFPEHEHGFKTPFILFTKDLHCSAVTKTRHAQQIGASALVIGYTYCDCSDPYCGSDDDDDDPRSSCTDEMPPLRNDGSASDVSIPTFLLNYNTSETLKHRLRHNEKVLMEVQWGLRLENDTRIPLYVHLWTRAWDPLIDVETYRNIYAVMKKFPDAIFVPRFALIDGKKFDCDGSENGPCDHLCSNGGKYCTTHAKDLSGFAIVRETLRRLCIWKHYGNDSSDAYWHYIMNFKANCDDAQNFNEPSCIKDAYGDQIKPATIDQCMKASGDLEEDVKNTLLHEQLEKRDESSVVRLPQLTINHRPVEHFSSFALFSTLCSKYWESNVKHIPEICYRCGDCPNKIGCIEQGHCVGFSEDDRDQSRNKPKKHQQKGKSTPKNSSNHHFFWFVFVCLSGGAGYYYWKEREMRVYRPLQTDSYFQLTGEEM